MRSPALSTCRVPIKSSFKIQSERLLEVHVTDVRTFYNGRMNGRCHWRIYAGASLLSSRITPYIYIMCSSPEKDTDRPEFRFCCYAFSPVRAAPNMGWVGLAARNDVPNTANFKLVRFPAAALCCWAPSRSRPDTRQDPQISFSSDSGTARAPSCARQPVVAAGGEWLALRRADLSAVEEQCLGPPWCGSGHRCSQVRDGGGISTGPRRSWFPGTGPCLRFPRRNPNGFLPQILRSGIPG